MKKNTMRAPQRKEKLKAQIWNLVAKKGSIDVKSIAKELKLKPEDVRYHLSSLERTKHVLRNVGLDKNNRPIFLYAVTEKFFETEYHKYEDLPKEVASKQPASHVRVVRLLDNPLPPAPTKRKSVLVGFRGIGSSMGDLG